MELLMWLEQVYLWQLRRKEKAAMFGSRNDKITEHVGYVPSQAPQKHMLDRAVEEYKRGQLSGLEQDDDPTAQRVLNEIKVRAIDDMKHSRR